MRHLITVSLFVASVAFVACDTDSTTSSLDREPTTTTVAVVEEPDTVVVESCDESSAMAEDGIETARLNAASCRVDADCVATWTVTGCGEDFQAIAKASAEGFAAEVAAVDHQLCTERAPSCSPTVTDYAVTPVAMCVSGSCELMAGE